MEKYYDSGRVIGRRETGTEVSRQIKSSTADGES
jgi:hypothetical protein